MRIFLERIPGGGKQALDGGDEDEHDEGAHQVGLEHLVPHLGVLQQEREDRKERRKMRRRVSRWTQPETPRDTETHATVRPRQASERETGGSGRVGSGSGGRGQTS